MDNAAAARPPALAPGLPAALERTAAELAAAAGARITAALDGELAVDFKPPPRGGAGNSNPVSRVDREVESFLRGELARRFPGHGVIGEEFAAAPGPEGRFDWVIDPVDGTSNFINSLPLYGCSIGVLCEGWPVAGAIWCSATHRLGPGVYHAREGGTLCLDGAAVVRRGAGPWRGLVAEHGRSAHFGARWDLRVLGAATLEFAYVACGALRHAFIPAPHLWDVAAGVVLARAGGCRVLWREDGRWMPLQRLAQGEAAAAARELAGWSHPVLIGDPSALDEALQDGDLPDADLRD